jgi:O-antigen ligase
VVAEKESAVIKGHKAKDHHKKQKLKQADGTLKSANGSSSIYLNWIRGGAMIVMLVTVAMLLILGPFYRGLFFTHQLLIAQATIFSLLVVWGVFRLTVKEDKFTINPLDLCLIVLFLAYTVSLFVAANQRAALEQTLKIAAYLVVYLVAADICRYWPVLKGRYKAILIGKEGDSGNSVTPGAGLVLHLLAAAALIVTIASLGVAAGHWSIVGAYHDAGYRIASPMGYSNTAAAYLMAAYFLTLALAPLAEKWWLRALYLAPATLMLTTVILTFSRGAWLLLLPLVILMLITTAPGYRLRAFSYFLATTLPALPAAFFADPLFRSAVPAQAWGPLVTALFAAVIIGIFSELLLAQDRKVKLVTFGIVIIGFGIALYFMLMPFTGQIKSEQLSEAESQAQEEGPIIEGIQADSLYLTALNRILPERYYDRIFSPGTATNFEARLEMFRDAIRIIKDYPLIGKGGGAWAALYQGYQQRVYYSSEVHNHFLQVWIEAGIFGFLAFVGIWISLAAAFIRYCLLARAEPPVWQRWTAVCLPAAALGAHSMIDWNFSLAAVGIYLFVLLGVSRSMDAERWFFRTKAAVTGRRIRRCGLLIGFTAIFSGLFLLVYTLVLLNGFLNTWRSQQSLARGDLMQAVVDLGRAIKYDPLRADNYHNLGILFDEEARSSGDPAALQQLVYLAQRASELEPYNPLYTFRYGEMLVNYVDVQQGLQLIDRVTALRPLAHDTYKQAGFFRLRLAEYYLGNNSQAEAESVLSGIAELERAMQEKIGDTSSMTFILGRASFMLGNYSEAEKYFVMIREGEPYFEEAQMYLDALQ